MYKRLLILATLSLGAMLCACEASFVNPVTELTDTTKVPQIDTFSLKWYNAKVHPYQMTGFVISNQRCYDTLPPDARVIVGWELPYYPKPHGSKEGAYYFFGSGVVNRKYQSIPWAKPPFPTKGYKLDLTVDSILPKCVIWHNADSTQALAVGHIFLINSNNIKEGDTILHSDLRTSDILGGVTETAIVYQLGTPVLLGQQLNNSAISNPGFNFLRGYSGFDPDQDPNNMKAVHLSFPSAFYLFVDEDDDHTERNNPMWFP